MLYNQQKCEPHTLKFGVVKTFLAGARQGHVQVARPRVALSTIDEPGNPCHEHDESNDGSGIVGI